MPPPADPKLLALYEAARKLARLRVQRDRAGRFAEAMARVAEAYWRERGGRGRAGDPAAKGGK